MTDSDKKHDPSVCLIRGEKCIEREHIVALEESVAALGKRVDRIDVTGTKELTRLSDQITGAERARAPMFEELVKGVRTLNAWAPSVDTHFQGISLRQGELAAKVEHLSGEVRELQGIVKNGNGRIGK